MTIVLNGTTGIASPSLTEGTLTYTAANALITAQSSASNYNQVIIQNSNAGAGASAGSTGHPHTADRPRGGHRRRGTRGHD